MMGQSPAAVIVLTWCRGAARLQIDGRPAEWYNFAQLDQDMEMTLLTTTISVAATRPALHQPVGLPLVTNGPDSAADMDSEDTDHRCGCSWSQRPA
jgi:hypothetical protein